MSDFFQEYNRYLRVYGCKLGNKRNVANMSMISKWVRYTVMHVFRAGGWAIHVLDVSRAMDGYWGLHISTKQRAC